MTNATFDIFQNVLFRNLHSNTRLMLNANQIAVRPYENILVSFQSKDFLEFLCILKKMKSKRKFSRQLVTKFIEIF